MRSGYSRDISIYFSSLNGHLHISSHTRDVLDEFQPYEFELTIVNKILSSSVKSEREKLAVNKWLMGKELILTTYSLFQKKKKVKKLKGICYSIISRRIVLKVSWFKKIYIWKCSIGKNLFRKCMLCDQL